MSETAQLLCYYDPKDTTSSSQLIVGGIALQDKEIIAQDYAPITRTIGLNWSVDQAERLAAYYEEHFAPKQPGVWQAGWNCHNLATTVMGWDVFWKSNCAPQNVRTIAPMSAQELQNGVPYVIKNYRGKIIHSLMGITNPTKNLAVCGYKQKLMISSNEHTINNYGGPLWSCDLVPLSPLGRLIRRALGQSSEFPEDYLPAVKSLRVMF